MRSRYRDALVHRQFRALFVSQLVSVAGTTVAAVTLTVLVYGRTGSPLLSSLTFALGFVPFLLGGILSSISERVPPRRLVSACSAASAGAAACMAWPDAPIPLLLGLLVAVGMLTSISSGAGAALLRGSVPPEAYAPARSLVRVVGQLAQIGGNAAGGVLLVVLTPGDAMLVNAASFAAAALLVRLGVDELERPREPAESTVLRDSLAGIRVVFADRELRRLLLLGWLVPTFAVAPEALAAPYVAGAGASPALVGIWLCALPLGMIAGDLLGVWRLTSEAQRRAVAPAAALAFLPYLAFLAHPPVAVALPLLAASGMCALYALGLDLRVRDATPERTFARVMTINSAGLMTLQGVGFALAGAEAELIGSPPAIALAGGCGLCAAVLFGPWRSAQPGSTDSRGAGRPPGPPGRSPAGLRPGRKACPGLHPAGALRDGWRPRGPQPKRPPSVPP
ncbi:MAG TPA: MFS transporter [Gaiellaceae bacterium]|nr:MFS transporter [Gaiellaceae bacterium]